MLIHWTTHDEYLQFISDAISILHPSRLKDFAQFSQSLDKLTSINLDPVGLHLLPYYSPYGRPALNQPQILRSFILMMDQGFTSLTEWVKKLKSNEFLTILIGCTTNSLPPLGSYYDFIDRLWLRNPDFEPNGRNDLFPHDKNRKPASKPGADKKLPNRHPGITKILAERALDGKDFPFHYEKLLQELFSIAAIVPSMELGLIPSDGITISGDGTAVHTHSNSYGHKVCDCYQSGVRNCSCDRHFSDPDAAWGWDSDLKCYFFGYSLYMFSFHNHQYATDLPLHIRFVDARRHDSVTGIVALNEFRSINPNLKILNLCLDSAHDNYPTYNLCKEWEIRPFIDMNTNRGRPKTIPDEITIDSDGTPICQAGFRMVYWGHCAGRSRCKWRCPLACGKVSGCSCKDSCSPSTYGRCIYTKPAWDVRLYTPVARGTAEYKKTYNNRTSSERMNNRILNDYQLHDMKIHSKKRYSFFAMIAGINIHLDARLKKRKVDEADAA